MARPAAVNRSAAKGPFTGAAAGFAACATADNTNTTLKTKKCIKQALSDAIGRSNRILAATAVAGGDQAVCCTA
jgi:hypothetical protein